MKARISVALVKGSDLDLTSAAGRMYAGVLGEFDIAESEIKAERVAAGLGRHGENQVAGALIGVLVLGGGSISFTEYRKASGFQHI